MQKKNEAIMAEDYYVILQVRRQATAGEIRSAYRRRAMELHPALSGSNSEAFLGLQKAYGVLGDSGRRAVYDREARAIPIERRQARGGPPPSAEPFREVEAASGFREVSLARSFATFEPSFEELFERFWGNFDLSSRPKAEHLESLTVDVPLSSEEALSGGSVGILVPGRETCPRCQGRGGVGYYECWRCQGQGALAVEHPLEVAYPAGLRQDYVVRVLLDDFGIGNFYLTVRLRPTGAA
ncbi:putative DnaJ-class molecular chaperone with C-terminal Zn finger domain [Verrucomicrobia bacterium]|nr:putative DnaJ-class molecular chaperone with C-terminal Zn finger domain [Verrucomicrobiota bacterium]